MSEDERRSFELRFASGSGREFETVRRYRASFVARAAGKRHYCNECGRRMELRERHLAGKSEGIYRLCEGCGTPA